MSEEFARCLAGIIRLFFFVFCPINGLQLSIAKLKIDKSPNKTPNRNILLEAVFGKVFCTNASMLRGRHKAILFIFISHSLLTIGSWEKLGILSNFPLKFTVNLKPKQFQISRIS